MSCSKRKTLFSPLSVGKMNCLCNLREDKAVKLLLARDKINSMWLIFEKFQSNDLMISLKITVEPQDKMVTGLQMQEMSNLP